MEFLLAAFGLAAAVWMIWSASARSRRPARRDAGAGEGNGAKPDGDDSADGGD